MFDAAMMLPALTPTYTPPSSVNCRSGAAKRTRRMRFIRYSGFRRRNRLHHNSAALQAASAPLIYHNIFSPDSCVKQISMHFAKTACASSSTAAVGTQSALIWEGSFPTSSKKASFTARFSKPAEVSKHFFHPAFPLSIPASSFAPVGFPFSGMPRTPPVSVPDSRFRIAKFRR